MIIHGLTVCVDYAEYLAVSLDRWTAGLASLLVVTTERDHDTISLCHAHGIRCFITDVFYADGASFNKGRAMEAARRTMTWADWILLFDADVVPPAEWKGRLKGLDIGYLYGCRRFAGTPEALEDRGQRGLLGDVAGVGYFQLFHSADPAALDDPLIECHWLHAGNYDNRLMDRWRYRGRVRDLPFRLAHLGERENWFGRGHRAEFLAMQAERKRRGGKWDHERIGATP